MTSLTGSESGLRSAAVRPARGWMVVAGQELRDIWLSARGPVIVIMFSLLLSLLTYLAATNKELNIVDQKGTVNLVVQITLGIGVAVSLLFSADALSGERERETLESLLLTPVPRRQIALGKLLAAVSVWPVMMAVAIPYIWVLRPGSTLFTDAIVAGFVVGSLLTAAFAALGIIVSTFSNSNRLSLVTSFFAFVVLLAPAQLTLNGWLGDFINHSNPMTAATQYLDTVLIDSHTWSQDATWLVSPILAALITTTAAFLLAGRLRLQGGIGR